METILVTIIIPVYNVEKYLKTCIDSIITQSHKNIEIILVNDGSTDSSLEICNNYLYDIRVHLIDKPNEGLSSARQIGIDKANGQYICMVDSDDYIEKDFVKKMVNRINVDNSDICVCATRFYGENYNRVYGFNKNINPISKITKEDIELNYFILNGYYYMSDSWNKIYRTDFIRNSRVKFTLEKLYNGTDLLFNHLLMLHCPQISVLNEHLYNHQMVENSRVRRKNKQMQKGFMIIMSKIICEVDNLFYLDTIDKQLKQLYIRFLRTAAQDIFNSGFSSNEFKKIFNEFYAENKHYLILNPRLKMNISQIETLSLKMFYYCIKRNRSAHLFIYLRLRNAVLKLIDIVNNNSAKS